MRTALLNSDNVVINIVVAEPDWVPPQGVTAVIGVRNEVDFGWQYLEGAWTAPSLYATFDDAREAAHTHRSEERMRREATTYEYDGHRYHCDQRSVDRRTEVDKLAFMAFLGGAPNTVIVPSGWRDVDGVPRLYTAAEFVASQQAFVAFGGACDAASQAIKADIDAAESIEALEAIIAAIPSDARWPA